MGSKANTSVYFGKLLLPSNSVASVLHQFVQPCVLHSEGMGKYHMSKSGTMTRLKVGNRYFGIVSRHQLEAGSYTFDQVCLLEIGSGRLSTSNRVMFQEALQRETTDRDHVVFDFTESVGRGYAPKHYFYDLSKEFCQERVPEPSIVLALGYPGAINLIDYENDSFIPTAATVYGFQTKPRMEDRLAFTPNPTPFRHEPNGLSGGAVFGFLKVGLEFHIFFAGMMTNASREIFHFVSRSQLRQTLTSIQDETKIFRARG